MAEEKPSLHIDLDWKKQAQEEKKRLEEEEKKRAAEREAAAAAAPVPAAVVPAAGATPAPGARAPKGRGGEREIPPASVQSIAQSLSSQAMFYLSDMATQRGDEISNMDMAKHLIDSLGVLETKTAGNLTEEEQSFLNLALYETRMRFISVASSVIAGS